MGFPTKRATRTEAILEDNALPCKRSRLDEDETEADQQKQVQIIRLEEEILLLERSMKTIQERKRSIDDRLEEGLARRDKVRTVLDGHLQRKRQLDDSQIQHQNLFRELHASLSKSREILLRLHVGGGRREIDRTTPEPQRLEERTDEPLRKQELHDTASETSGDDDDDDVASPVDLWLFLESDNLDWLLAVDSMDLSSKHCELEKVFIRGKLNGDSQILVNDLLENQYPTTMLHSWPNKADIYRDSDRSDIVIALANFPVDLSYMNNNISFMLSTKEMTGQLDGFKHYLKEVSHAMLGGVTAKCQAIAICELGDKTIDLDNEFAIEADREGRSIQSILEQNVTQCLYQFPGDFPTTIEPLRPLTLNGERQPPIYHCGGLLPPIFISQETLVGYPSEEKGMWRVRQLTRKEVSMAYDINEPLAISIGPEFVPLRILRASLDAMLSLILPDIQLQPIGAYSCPVTPALDDQRLEQFWNGHCKTADPHCLFSFMPSIGDPVTIKKIMDVNATEALMTDMACAGDIEAAAAARRHTLRNTCLDLVLMSGDDSELVAANSEIDNYTSDSVDDEVVVTVDVEHECTNHREPSFSLAAETNAIGTVTKDATVHLDPNVPLCPYELLGVCADPYCPYQHLDKKDGPKIVPREMLPLPALKLPKEPFKLEDTSECDEDAEISKDHNIFPQADGEQKEQAPGGDPNELGKAEFQQGSGGERGGGEYQSHNQPFNSSNLGNRDCIGVNGQQTSNDGEKEANTNSGNAVDNSNPADNCSVPTEEFEANIDFIAFGDDDYDERGEDGNGDEDEFMTLETARLLDWGSDASRAQSLEDRAKKFWWQSTFQPIAQLPAFDDWLRMFADFHVIRNDADVKAHLEYRGPIPTSSFELCAFAARTVDCARLMVQAGRFDLTVPLSTISLNVLEDGSKGRDLKGMKGLLQEAVILTCTVLDFAYSSQNGYIRTFRCQLILAMLSDSLLDLYEELRRDKNGLNTTNWVQYNSYIVGLGNLLPGTGRTNYFEDDDRKQSASYVLESLKFELFRRNRSNGAKAGESASLMDDTRNAISFAHAVRLRFSVLSVADGLLKPVWSIVKTSLQHPIATGSMKSTSGLRSCIYICYFLLGVLGGVANRLKDIDGDPRKLCALTFSSLVQIDGTIYGILKSLNNTLCSNAKVPMLNLLLTPLVAASVSLACNLGFYAKAQHRLEEALSTGSGTNGMPFAELLWSQLIHLRACLPFGQQITVTKEAGRPHNLPPADVSLIHQKLADKVALYGVCPHHLSLPGDWSLLSRWNVSTLQGSDIATTNAMKLKRQFKSLLRLGVSMVLQTNTMVQAPVSRPALVSADFTAEFPRSLLVYGQNMKYLNLAWCQLREMPHSFGLQLPNLKTLDISDNNLEYLPDSFGELQNLDTLLANNNMLKDLPESLGDLTNSLRKLQLRDNCLQSFPALVWRLKLLEELQLSGNNFEMLDSALLTLVLPKLRIFLAPEMVVRADGARDDESEKQYAIKHSPIFNKNAIWRDL